MNPTPSIRLLVASASRTSRVTRAFPYLCIALFATACGRASFKGSSKEPERNSVAAKGSATKADTSEDGAPANKSGDTQAKQGAGIGVKDAGALVLSTKEFDARAVARSVDVVWVIDTSGSMDDEIKKTRENLLRFQRSLATRRDVKTILLAKDGDVRLDLSSEVAAILTQIPIEVASKDALILLAAGLCDKASTSSNAKLVCGKPVSWEAEKSDGAAGTLIPHLRPQARKVFVVVTDDDATGFRAAPFTDAIAGKFEGGYSVFAFRGKASVSGCRIAARGKEYEALAASTGGAVYDICDTDWTPHFDALLERVTELSSNAFTLAGTGAVAVVEVRVGGIVVPADKWVFSGDQLTIDEAVLKAAVGAKIEVAFKHPR